MIFAMDKSQCTKFHKCKYSIPSRIVISKESFYYIVSLILSTKNKVNRFLNINSIIKWNFIGNDTLKPEGLDGICTAYSFTV